MLKSKQARKFFEDMDDIWGRMVLRTADKKAHFVQGDALVAKNQLEEAGLEWGKDYYLKKEE